MHLNFVKELELFLFFLIIPILLSETERVALGKHKSLGAENLNIDVKRIQESKIFHKTIFFLFKTLNITVGRQTHSV